LVLEPGLILAGRPEKMGQFPDNPAAASLTHLDVKSLGVRAKIRELKIIARLEKGTGAGGIAETVGKGVVAAQDKKNRALTPLFIINIRIFSTEKDQVHVENPEKITGPYPEVQGGPVFRHEWNKALRQGMAFRVPIHGIAGQDFILGKEKGLERILGLMIQINAYLIQVRDAGVQGIAQFIAHWSDQTVLPGEAAQKRHQVVLVQKEGITHDGPPL
jgi:hypothetical protein